MKFLDNFLKKLGTKLATRYGWVPSGKYSECHIALGNPPKQKVSSANSFSQIIFIKEDEEVARMNISTDIIDIEYIETIKFPQTGNDGYRCTITSPDGETCDVDLFPSKIRVFYNNTRTFMREETDKFFKDEIAKMPQA